MSIQMFHHIAYRCRDAQETVDFYTKALGLKFTAALRHVSRYGDGNRFLHIFFQLPDGSNIAFFDLPQLEGDQWSSNTPRWVQHIAFQVEDLDALMQSKRRLEEAGVEVEGPKKGEIIGSSIYFWDPSGHRLELTTKHLPKDPSALEKQAEDLLVRWNAEKVNEGATQKA
jgi:catechol 2,3-dioxygenase-like lactoylglutathione lyase family enzyme